MPSLLFHQNMRTFGGGGGWLFGSRNAAYNAAFGGVQAGLGVGTQIDVAGFTEIMNAGASVAALTTFGDTLFGVGVGGGAQLFVVACGQTALANGPEYIGIAVRPGLAVASIGRILFKYAGCLTFLHEQIALPAAGIWNNLPMGVTLDYRGLVYVVVAIGGVNIAVGFLHNLYTYDVPRVLVSLNIKNMLTQMSEIGLPLGPLSIQTCYIGGDFNFLPHNIGTASRGLAYSYSLGAPTTATHVYDYWYSRIYPGPMPGPVGSIVPAPGGVFRIPVPSINITTRNVPIGLSDHAAVMLQITN